MNGRESQMYLQGNAQGTIVNCISAEVNEVISQDFRLFKNISRGELELALNLHMFHKFDSTTRPSSP